MFRTWASHGILSHASIMQQDQVSALQYMASGSKLPIVSDQYGIKADHQIRTSVETDMGKLHVVLSDNRL